MSLPDHLRSTPPLRGPGWVYAAVSIFVVASAAFLAAALSGASKAVLWPVGLVSVGASILLIYLNERRTRQEQARRALADINLQQSEQRYRWLFENTSEAIWRVELDEPVATQISPDEQIDAFYRFGTLAECNPAMARMYGFESPDQMKGIRLDDLMPRAEQRNIDYLREFIRASYRLADTQSVERDRAGNIKHISNTLVGVVEDGKVLRAWGISVDVTRRHLAEEQLTAARDSAQAANRAKDRFLAVLSHELRTPLAPVVSTVESLLSESGIGPEHREMLEMMQRNVELESHLIDDLLDLTRIVNNKLELTPQPLDLHQCIRQTVQNCDADFAGKEQHVTLDLTATNPHVRGDGARLQQVLSNLLKNANKFTPTDGLITIRTREAGNEDNGKAHNDGTGSNGSPAIYVEITDTGIGIDAALLPRIFDAFEQGEAATTRRYGGLGLGLAISKALTELHGGTLSAASGGRNHGATFTLRLPQLVGTDFVVPPAPAPRAIPAIAAPTPTMADNGLPLRILLVEDHPDTSRAIARLLRGSGYTVFAANSLAAAVQSAREEPVDLLISDIGLPDGSGLDLIRQLAPIRPIPAIVISGFGMEEDVQKSREAGFAHHLTKPVNIDQLEEAIRRIAPRQNRIAAIEGDDLIRAATPIRPSVTIEN